MDEDKWPPFDAGRFARLWGNRAKDGQLDDSRDDVTWLLSLIHGYVEQAIEYDNAEPEDHVMLAIIRGRVTV